MLKNRVYSHSVRMSLGALLLTSVGFGGTALAATSTKTVSPSFAPVISQAMKSLSNTKIPLMAPTSPVYSPQESQQGWHMGAVVNGNASSYTVALQWANRALPINSKALSEPPNTGLAQVIGGFTGTEYSSASQALAALYVKPKHGEIAPAYLAPPKNAKETSVYLGHGIEGKAIHTSFYPMVQWHEGDWTLQVTDMPINDDVQTAKQLVTYLNSHLLPETHGVFGVNLAGDGEHTSVKWVYGNVVYTCSDYHSALQAAMMAVSMRVYPGGQLKPPAAGATTPSTGPTTSSSGSTAVSHYLNGTVVSMRTSGYNPEFIHRPYVLESMSIRVNQNELATPNVNPNVPLKIGSIVTLRFNSQIPPGTVTPRVGDMVFVKYSASTPINPSKPPVLQGSWNGFEDNISWIDLTSPVSGTTISPGQTLHITGFVPDPLLWGKSVNVNIFAGYIKVSNTWDSTGIRVGTDGLVDARIQLPKTMPKLHGNAFDLTLQPAVRQGPITQILLMPAKP